MIVAPGVFDVAMLADRVQSLLLNTMIAFARHDDHALAMEEASASASLWYIIQHGDHWESSNRFDLTTFTELPAIPEELVACVVIYCAEFQTSTANSGLVGVYATREIVQAYLLPFHFVASRLQWVGRCSVMNESRLDRDLWAQLKWLWAKSSSTFSSTGKETLQ